MKNYRIILLLFFAVISVGCKSVKQPAAETEEPPCIIVLNSDEEYEALRQAPQLSDEELEAYLSANGFTMNGASNRQELLILLDELEAIPFPRIDGAKLIWMDYYPETGERGILFQYPDGSQLVIRNVPQGDSIDESEWDDITEQLPLSALESVCQSKTSSDMYLLQSGTHLFSVRFSDLKDQSSAVILQKLSFKP